MTVQRKVNDGIASKVTPGAGPMAMLRYVFRFLDMRYTEGCYTMVDHKARSNRRVARVQRWIPYGVNATDGCGLRVVVLVATLSADIAPNVSLSQVKKNQQTSQAVIVWRKGSDVSGYSEIDALMLSLLLTPQLVHDRPSQ